MLNSHFTFDPLKVKTVESLSTSDMGAVFLTRPPPFEKTSNCRVSALALEATRRASSSDSTMSSPRSTSSFANEILPMIPERKLLKSWAKPPAITPSDSSFWALRSSCSSFFFSVMSWNTVVTLTGLAFSYSILELINPQISRPSLAMISVSAMSGTDSPLMILSYLSSCFLRLCSVRTSQAFNSRNSSLL